MVIANNKWLTGHPALKCGGLTLTSPVCDRSGHIIWLYSQEIGIIQFYIILFQIIYYIFILIEVDHSTNLPATIWIYKDFKELILRK